jgi:cobalamin biosynthesis protein CobT
MNTKKAFSELMEEMLELAGVPLNEKEESKDKEDLKPEKPEDVEAEEADEKDSGKDEPAEDSEEDTEEVDDGEEISDQWTKKIGGHELQVIWRNKDKVARIKYRGNPFTELKVPAKLVESPIYRKPFKTFLLKVFDYMAGEKVASEE